MEWRHGVNELRLGVRSLCKRVAAAREISYPPDKLTQHNARARAGRSFLPLNDQRSPLPWDTAFALQARHSLHAGRLGLPGAGLLLGEIDGVERDEDAKPSYGAGEDSALPLVLSEVGLEHEGRVVSVAAATHATAHAAGRHALRRLRERRAPAKTSRRDHAA